LIGGDDIPGDAVGVYGQWTYREKLVEDRTYYVRTDGDDNNSGLEDSAGGAFLTIQKAVDTIYGLDWSIYDVTISVGDGTYEDPVVVLGPNPGSGIFSIVGNVTTPSDALIDITGDIPFTFGGMAVVEMAGFKLQSTGESGIKISEESSLTLVDLMDFGEVSGGSGHIRIDGGRLKVVSDYTISGSATIHLNLQYNAIGTAILEDAEITLTGTPAFSIAFCFVRHNSVVFLDSVSFTGSATGTRYSVQSGSVISAGGATLPGNAAGTGTTFDVDPYGLYLA
jgi:hypothetical protein